MNRLVLDPLRPGEGAPLTCHLLWDRGAQPRLPQASCNSEEG